MASVGAGVGVWPRKFVLRDSVQRAIDAQSLRTGESPSDYIARLVAQDLGLPVGEVVTGRAFRPAKGAWTTARQHAVRL